MLFQTNVQDANTLAREYYMKKLSLPIESKVEARDNIRYAVDISTDGVQDQEITKFTFMFNRRGGTNTPHVSSIPDPLCHQRILRVHKATVYDGGGTDANPLHTLNCFMHASFSDDDYQFICRVSSDIHLRKKRYKYATTDNMFTVWFTYDGRENVVKFKNTKDKSFLNYTYNFTIELVYE